MAPTAPHVRPGGSDRAVGTADTRLVVLRGNSGSGKSQTAKELRRLGRGVAWVEQDHLRRILLREHDVPGGVNIGLIDTNVRYALDHGYDVVLEGILTAARYGAMLAGLAADHRGRTAFYYFDIPLAETLVRHASRPLAAEVSADQVTSWYQYRDLLGVVEERIIGPDSGLTDTVARIQRELDWWPGGRDAAGA